MLRRSREELKQMDQRTRKPMTMHKALHPRNDVDRLYVSRKEGGKGLASTEDSVDASIQQLKYNIEKREGGLIKAIKNDTDNTVTNRMTLTSSVIVIVVGNGHGDTSSNPGRD